jgi:rhodanese-related sulfurtransferase
LTASCDALSTPGPFGPLRDIAPAQCPGDSGATHARRQPYFREEFDPQRRTILYCAAGGRSALAADALQQLGYINVAHLDGGFKAWSERGLPIAGR